MSDVSQADCAATENADTKYPLTDMLRTLVENCEAGRKNHYMLPQEFSGNVEGVMELTYAERQSILQKKLGISEVMVNNLLRNFNGPVGAEGSVKFLNACGIAKTRPCYTTELSPSMVRELHVVKLKSYRQAGHSTAIRRLATHDDWVVVLNSVKEMIQITGEGAVGPWLLSTDELSDIIKKMTSDGIHWAKGADTRTRMPHRIFLDDAAVIYQQRIRQQDFYKQVGRCFQIVPTIVEVG